jgi:pyrroloquinoline quinone biosynthesis protein B
MRTSLIILGSGQDGGSPQVGQPSSESQPRCASSVAVVGPEGAVVLLDASPDLRTQSQALLGSDLYPPNRASFVDGVCITHAHMGHYAGLLHFGKEAAAESGLPLLGTKRFLAYMEANDPWAELIRDGHLDPIAIDGMEASIDGDLTLSAIAVPHRDEYSDTIAFSISVAGQPWLLYLPDIDDWQSWDEAEQVIARHEVALLDATFSSVHELPGRDISAIRHPLVPDTIERFAHLVADTQIVLTHINHSNSLGNPDAAITRQAASAGFIVAYDGMTMSRDG